MARRQIKGEVVSDKPDKTVVVRIEQWKRHPKYIRRFRMHTRHKAHDEKNEYKVGDQVIIEESRPMSADKRWRVIKKA